MEIDIPTALLQMLRDGPSYGIALVDDVRTRTLDAVRPSQGATYAALKAMADDGLVETFLDDRTTERGGRPRRYFKLTAAGRRRAHADRLAASRLFTLSL